MSKLKFMVGAIMAIILLFVFTEVLNNPEKDVKKFIEINQEKLIEISNEYLAGNTDLKTYRGVRVDGVIEGDHEVVRFYQGGTGVALRLTHYGFYYSPDDVPVANIDADLEQIDENQWQWQEEGTENKGTTKRICENWFFYEATGL